MHSQAAGMSGGNPDIIAILQNEPSSPAIAAIDSARRTLQAHPVDALSVRPLVNAASAAVHASNGHVHLPPSPGTGAGSSGGRGHGTQGATPQGESSGHRSVTTSGTNAPPRSPAPTSAPPPVGKGHHVDTHS